MPKRDPFAVFVNKTLFIFESSDTTGEEGGVVKSWRNIGELRGHAQPYTGGLALQQYGYAGECSIRFLLSDDTDLLVEGRAADVDPNSSNPRFTIVYTPQDLSYKVALLKGA